MHRMTTFLWVTLISVPLVPLHSSASTPKNELIAYALPFSEAELSLMLTQGNDIPYVIKPLMVALATTWLTLKSLEHAHTSEIRSLRQRLKDSFIEYVGTPAYITYDRIKHHGLTKKDLCIMAAVLVALYGAKKGADHYHLGSALRSWDFRQLRRKSAEDLGLLSKYRAYILLGVGTLTALGFLIKAALNLPIIERFKRSLTRQQKEIISSDTTLVELINNAHENPAALADHSHLIPDLHERQRMLLHKAVEKYKSEADPLSLFDDFMMDSES